MMQMKKRRRKNMSRYIADYTINKPDDLIKFIAEDFLTK